MSEGAEIILWLLLAIAMFFVGAVTGQDMVRDRAIDAGVAHQVCDVKGDCEFQWIK